MPQGVLLVLAVNEEQGGDRIRTPVEGISVRSSAVQELLHPFRVAWLRLLQYF
jgi:hypothetical protein